jgi:hypothetical protein
VKVNGIGISGKAGAGKSTLREAIVKQLRGGPREGAHASFAAAVKDEVFQLYGITKADPGGRAALIAHSEEQRARNPAHWIDQLRPELDRLVFHPVVPIVDDVRYRNERDFLEQRGFLLVRVEAGVTSRAMRLSAAGLETDVVGRTDATECDLDGRDDWQHVWYTDRDFCYDCAALTIVRALYDHVGVQTYAACAAARGPGSSRNAPPQG